MLELIGEVAISRMAIKQCEFPWLKYVIKILSSIRIIINVTIIVIQAIELTTHSLHTRIEINFSYFL